MPHLGGTGQGNVSRVLKTRLHTMHARLGKEEPRRLGRADGRLDGMLGCPLPIRGPIIGSTSMWEWYIVYEGDQRVEVRSIERRAHKETKERFRAANAAGYFTFDNRAVAGMWVINRGRQREDVVLVHGQLPQEIQMRHAARNRH